MATFTLPFANVSLWTIFAMAGFYGNVQFKEKIKDPHKLPVKLFFFKFLTPKLIFLGSSSDIK